MQGRSDDQRELLDAESVAGHLLKSDSMFAFLAAHRSRLFPEEMFADLFPSRRGRPSVPAEVMASVITLQALHGLSDNETVEAVTFDLRWKAACGLPITAGAFHSTTLTYWRRRLADSQRPDRIFEAVKAVVAETGVLAKKTRRALDSTVLDDAVATQDTVTQLIAAIRRVAREVPGAGQVIEAQCSAHDYDDPGKPAIAWNDKSARDQLVDGLVGDAHRLLGHLPEQDLGPRAAEAVALLALIAGQDVEPVEGSDGTDGQWQIAQKVAPDRVISTVDPETRHAHKTVHRRQDGFKAHIAVEPDTGIITSCALTKATGSDNHEGVVGLALLDGEPAPVRVLGDSAYGTGDTRAALAELKHVAVIKPIPLRPALPGGFTLDDFAVDLTEGTVTCPAGLTRTITAAGNAVFGTACAPCRLRAQCTRAVDGKTAKISPHHALQRSARAESRKATWIKEYRQHRPMVERTIAWLTRGNRKVRYRGVAKNDHWLHHRSAALNLRRLLTLGLTHTGTAWAIA
ncbi:IS1182 family transposase [Mycobacterium sp. CVI_P3]|uniref:IS1182 family transposase n=1 Tax=Mycobacterium pinniadriaticum TaxID=2994102 RepID=A0ABT3SPK9_9MYCO|nr:IS1182 family transposase [Mycobacterium pinniadriaticum]MCX2935034.1 IS1182 family transposase [Mycobacterium pinniadriaticum]MCX2941456.1 IS1182 family transposase [Mycobacterium pinniadriaticum]